MELIILCALCSLAFFIGMKVGEDSERNKNRHKEIYK